jgi:hypothetical protein
MPSTIATCKSYYLVQSGDYCALIEGKFGITAVQFQAWNPYVGASCANLWLGIISVSAPERMRVERRL